jgi:hypothetical protein
LIQYNTIQLHCIVNIEYTWNRFISFKCNNRFAVIIDTLQYNTIVQLTLNTRKTGSYLLQYDNSYSLHWIYMKPVHISLHTTGFPNIYIEYTRNRFISFKYNTSSYSLHWIHVKPVHTFFKYNNRCYYWHWIHVKPIHIFKCNNILITVYIEYTRNWFI